MDRVVVLVDVQNVYYTARKVFGRNFDYNAFWQRVGANRTIVKAIAYAVDRGDQKQREFQNILRAIGFEVKLKPFIQRADGSAKGDWDVGITLDAIELAKEADVLVLVSGDGDFAILVDKLRADFAIGVEVYGVERLTSRALAMAASRYVPIGQSLLLG